MHSVAHTKMAEDVVQMANGFDWIRFALAGYPGIILSFAPCTRQPSDRDTPLDQLCMSQEWTRS